MNDLLAAAIVAVGLAEADAWWFGDAGETTVLFLIADERLARVPYTLSSLPLLISELTGALAFEHRRAFERFAADPLAGIEVVTACSCTTATTASPCDSTSSGGSTR